MKKFIAILLSACFIISSFVVPGFATTQTPNASFVVDKTTANVGDIITVTISNNAMNLAAYTAKLSFDKNLVECTGITGCYGDQYLGVDKTTGRNTWVEDILYPEVTPELIQYVNSNGEYPFAILSANNVEYKAGINASLTFTVKAAGTVSFVLYEDSAFEDSTAFYLGEVGTKTVTVAAPLAKPTISDIEVLNNQPNLFVNAETKLEVSADAGVDGATLNYQWQQKNGDDWTDITGATGNFYTPTLSEAGEFKYRVLVWNTKDGAASEKVESDEVTLYVDAVAQLAVAIEASTDKPSVGTEVTLTAKPTFANEHICDANCTSTYTWHKHVSGEEYVKIENATEASYTFTPTADGEHKFYVVMTHVQKHSLNPDVTMEVGAKSAVKSVAVSALPALTFTKDLSNQTLVIVNPIVSPSLTVEAKAPEGIDGTPSYQWYMNDEPISGETGPSLNINNFDGLEGDEIRFKVEAIFKPANEAIEPLVAVSTVQTVVILNVELKPIVTMNDAVVWQDGSVTLQPTIVDGVQDERYLTYLERTARAYSWSKSTDSLNWVSLGTTETCAPPTDTAGEVQYKLSVHDIYGIKTEYAVLDESFRNLNATGVATATVTVVAKAETPTVTVTASKNPAVLGETVTLTANANVNDGGTLSYQWYDADGTPIEGATDPTLSVSSDTVATYTRYVVVTNTKTHVDLSDNSVATATSDLVTVIFEEDAAFVAAKNALAAIGSVNAKFLDDAVKILANVKPMVTDAMTGIEGVRATVQDNAVVDGNTFTVTVMLDNGHTNVGYTLSVTINREENPSIALVEETLALLDQSDFAAIEQVDYPDEQKVTRAALEKALAAMEVTEGVSINTVSYNPPTAETYDKVGVDGSLVFTVSYTAAADDGDDYTGKSGQFTLTVTADPLTAEERVADAMNALGNVVNGITLAQKTADDLTTDAAVKAALETKINTELSTYGVTAAVAVTEFTTKPAAGSAATSREGTNGTVKYNVTLSYDDANQVMENLEKTITALRYTDVMDVDAYNAAIAALNALNVSGSDAGKLYVDFNSTDAAIKTAAENTIKAALDSLTAKNEAQTDVPTTVDYTIGNAEIAEKSIAVSVTVTKGSNSSQQTVTLTIVEGENPAIKIVADAMKALGELTFADVPYDQNMTQTTLVELVKGLAQNKIAKAEVNLDVIVESDGFKNAVPGTAANPTATQGSFTFKIKVTAGAVQVTETTEPITFAINAKDFDGLSDADAVEYAEVAFKALLAAGKINQDKATTSEGAKAAIEFMLKTAIEEKANGKSTENLTLTVNVTDFVAAEAGSAATTKEGKDGSLKITFSAQQGSKEYRFDVPQTLTITATPFNGVLDTEAVDAAKTALTGKTAIVPIRATEQQRLDAVQTFVNGYLTGNAAGVTATLAKSGDNAFTVTLTKGTVTDTVTVNWKEADPIKLAAPANVVFEQGVAEWEAVENAVSYIVTLYAGNTAGEKLNEFTTTELIYDLSAELQKGQSYVVTVKAIADGVFYVNSDESTASEVYAIKNDSMYDNLWFWVLLKQYSQVYPISASAGEGGTISPAGVSEVKYKKNLTYTITPDEGYAIAALWVDGVEQEVADTYTFKQVKAAHTIRVEFVKLGWDGPFTDVEPLADYAEAVRFVYENGYVNGVSETEFAPEAAMTRADLVTALGKMIGVDTTYYMNAAFTDVAADAAYAPYAAWAVDAKLLSAKEDGSFGVNDSMTIEQAAAVLAQFAAYVGLSTDSEIALDDYTDADTIAESARAAMKWIVESGIYAGENGALAPQAEASRALIAEMIYRFSALAD